MNPVPPILLAALTFLSSASATEPDAGQAPPDSADASTAERERVEQWVGRLAERAQRAARDPSLPFPPDFRLSSVEREKDGGLRVLLDGSFGPAPEEAASPALAQQRDELRLELLHGALLAADVASSVRFLVQSPSGGYRALGHHPETPAGQGTFERQSRRPDPSRTARFPKGAALLGKRIALSAGHGWTQGSSGGWGWQRAHCTFDTAARGILEDTYNAQIVSLWLVPLLENMGAEVVLPREADFSEESAIIDDGDAGHQEVGGWSAGSSAGGWADDYRAAGSTSDTASFTTTFQTSGWRRFQTWFREGANRTERAVYGIQHAGGTTAIDVDQTAYGRHFLDLGRYWCAAGEPCGVTLSNGADGALIADAVKLGGGFNSERGKPWWQMDAKSYVGTFLGKSDVVSGISDVWSRPRFAEAVDADLFLSIHGNAAGGSCSAGGSTAHGIATYRHNCYENVAAADCDHTSGSKKLSQLVHAATLARIRADWDPNFCNRKEHVANFGEVGQLKTMPGVLIETAFFDNLKTPQACSGSGAPKYRDNQSMQDPRWREALAYGIVEGIAQYFGTGGAPPVRPQGLRALNDATPCALTVSWDAVAGATGYRLYRIDDLRPGHERAFDAGTIVEGTSIALTGLKPGAVYVFRVAALDSNGEGLPSAAVTARVRAAGGAVQGLYVNGYDRRDAYVQEPDNDLAYAAEHGLALGAVGDDFFFDGALKEVVERGGLRLSPYAVIDFQAGKNSTEHHSLSSALQASLTDYLGAGGKLFLSGEEIAWDLGNKGNGSSFLADQLKARFVADDAGVFSMSGSDSGPFAGLSGITFDDGSHGIYEVVYPDAIDALAGANVAMTYSNGQGAAIASDDVIYFGLPLETVYPALSRAKLFACGIGRLLKGRGWTCTPSAIALPASGASTGSCSPSDPTDPLDPTDPTDPLDPTDPTDPLDPANPTDPLDPANPTDPLDPTDPAKQPGAFSRPTDITSGGCASAGDGLIPLPLFALCSWIALRRRSRVR